jgi:hypothetical protein
MAIHPTETAMLLAARVRVPERVVYRPFVNETVILNLETGTYHGVNPTGARMLDVLQRASSVRDAAARLAEEYRVPLEQMEQDVCEFCRDLLHRGLIELADAHDRR